MMTVATRDETAFHGPPLPVGCDEGHGRVVGGERVQCHVSGIELDDATCGKVGGDQAGDKLLLWVDNVMASARVPSILNNERSATMPKLTVVVRGTLSPQAVGKPIALQDVHRSWSE